MHIQFRKTLIASGIALAMLAGSGPAFAGDVSREVTEARLETQIWTTYAVSPYLRASDLKVKVSGDKATLTGTVEESVNKDLARQIALGVDGIKEVDNQIKVSDDLPAPVRSSSRSYGEVVDDATITAAVKSKLLWSKHTDGLSTDIDTRWGKVTLKGSADSAAAKELATRLAMNTRGVVSVDNQLAVKAKTGVVASTKAGAQTVGSEVADTWITTKVKSTFTYSSNVDSSDISVSTAAGIVTLSGKVDSGAERALAVELASNVRGVKSVRSSELTF